MGHNGQLKKGNILQVLQFVHSKGNRTTKRDIAAHTGLTIATVQNIICDLEDIGVITCYGVSSSTGGRKAQYYGINNNYRYLVGIYLRTNKITIGIFDYSINLIQSRSERLLLDEKPVEKLIHVMADMLNDFINEFGITKTMIAGAGINIPGPVDYENGRVIAIRGYLKWKNIALADKLGSLIQLPVFVDKDVYSGLSFLNWQKPSRYAKTMLYVSVEDGIGAAVMYGGKIFRGNHGFVAEIGHTTVTENGKKCACGNYGCLETVSSDFAIIDRCRNELGVSLKDSITIDDLIDLAKAGDRKIDAVFDEAAKCLSVSIRNTFALYDPDEIFINCRWLLQKKELYYMLLDSLYDDNNLIDRKNVPIHLIDIDDFGLKSAAAIAASNEIESFNSSVFLQMPKNHISAL